MSLYRAGGLLLVSMALLTLTGCVLVATEKKGTATSDGDMGDFDTEAAPIASEEAPKGQSASR